jgi:hypothetical protein
LIKLKTLYKHYKNQKDYETIDYCKMQVNGEWLEAVIYKSVDGDLYVRALADFEEKFTAL